MHRNGKKRTFAKTFFMKITKKFHQKGFKNLTGVRKKAIKNGFSLYEDVQKLVKLGWGKAVLLSGFGQFADRPFKLEDVTQQLCQNWFYEAEKLRWGSEAEKPVTHRLYFDGVNTFCLRPSAAVRYQTPLDFFAWVCEAVLVEPRQAHLSTKKGNKYLRNVTLADCEKWAQSGEEIIV